MSGSKIRRAQLVSPFGVGAMSVLVNGTSVITAGLDHWYPEDSPDFDSSEYIEHDWRLEARLHVKRVPAAARLPPVRARRRPAERQAQDPRAAVPALAFLPVLQAAPPRPADRAHARWNARTRKHRRASCVGPAWPRSRSWLSAHMATLTTSRSGSGCTDSHKPSCNGTLRLNSRVAAAGRPGRHLRRLPAGNGRSPASWTGTAARAARNAPP